MRDKVKIGGFLFAAMLAACSSTPSSDVDCGAGGSKSETQVGAVCSYAVISGGFRCPEKLPNRIEVPKLQSSDPTVVLCARAGVTLGQIPASACVGFEARCASSISDAGPDGSASCTEGAACSESSGMKPAACPIPQGQCGTTWQCIEGVVRSRLSVGCDSSTPDAGPVDVGVDSANPGTQCGNLFCNPESEACYATASGVSGGSTIYSCGEIPNRAVCSYTDDDAGRPIQCANCQSGLGTYNPETNTLSCMGI